MNRFIPIFIFRLVFNTKFIHRLFPELKFVKLLMSSTFFFLLDTFMSQKIKDCRVKFTQKIIISLEVPNLRSKEGNAIKCCQIKELFDKKRTV